MRRHGGYGHLNNYDNGTVNIKVCSIIKYFIVTYIKCYIVIHRKSLGGYQLSSKAQIHILDSTIFQHMLYYLRALVTVPTNLKI